jgi:PAS domain S-box-containing protein
MLTWIMGAFWIIRSFRTSLQNPENIVAQLVQGNTSVKVTTRDDEFAGVVTGLARLSENLKRSSDFARSIGEGNFDFQFQPVSDLDILGNSLLQMREKLKNIAESDKIRNWTTTGLAMFADLIRKSTDQQTLSDTLISQLVKYTKSNQGGLFILNRDQENDPFLELIACYAYDRKKYETKRIDVGTGLVGQCYLEASPINLRHVPENYVTITSGLGMSNPRSLLLVPLKLNDVVEGVLELASFTPYEQYEVDFVQRVGEIIASAITNARVSDRTRKMLAESQQQSEEMRAQEEEMRQNMEEMQATQEAMERQTNELKRIQTDLEMEKSMFQVLMEFLQDRITYKDTRSRIIRINKAKAERLNMRPEDVIGKTDYDFFSAEHAEKAMREEKELIDSGRPLMDIEERLTFNNGDTAWVSTSRIPFKDERNVPIGMFIITRDITKLKNAELSLSDRDRIIQRLLKELPILHYKLNKDKIITEAWVGKLDVDLRTFLSKPVSSIFSNVYKQIQRENPESEPVIDAIPTASGVVSMKHFIFQDNLHLGSMWVYAIRV